MDLSNRFLGQVCISLGSMQVLLPEEVAAGVGYLFFQSSGSISLF